MIHSLSPVTVHVRYANQFNCMGLLKKNLLGCLTCSAATDVGMLAWEFEDAPCLCTLLNSVVAAIVPSCLRAL